MLLKLRKKEMIVDYLKYMVIVKNHGKLRDLVELVLSLQHMESEEPIQPLIDLLIEKVDIDLLKLIQKISLDSILPLLTIQDVKLIRNRIDEIENIEFGIEWFLGAYFHEAMCGGVEKGIIQYCLRRLLHKLPDTGCMDGKNAILNAYCKRIGVQ